MQVWLGFMGLFIRGKKLFFVYLGDLIVLEIVAGGGGSLVLGYQQVVGVETYRFLVFVLIFFIVAFFLDWSFCFLNFCFGFYFQVFRFNWEIWVEVRQNGVG